MVAYEVFRALGVEVHVRPVMEHISKDMYEEYVVDELATHNHIGKHLSEPVNTNMETGENGGYELEEIYQALPSSLERVTWLNEPTPETESMQMAFLRVSFGILETREYLLTGVCEPVWQPCRGRLHLQLLCASVQDPAVHGACRGKNCDGPLSHRPLANDVSKSRRCTATLSRRVAYSLRMLHSCCRVRMTQVGAL
jgi:hypothetical protein